MMVLWHYLCQLTDLHFSIFRSLHLRAVAAMSFWAGTTLRPLINRTTMAALRARTLATFSLTAQALTSCSLPEAPPRLSLVELIYMWNSFQIVCMLWAQ